MFQRAVVNLLDGGLSKAKAQLNTDLGEENRAFTPGRLNLRHLVATTWRAVDRALEEGRSAAGGDAGSTPETRLIDWVRKSGHAAVDRAARSINPELPLGRLGGVLATERAHAFLAKAKTVLDQALDLARATLEAEDSRADLARAREREAAKADAAGSTDKV